MPRWMEAIGLGYRACEQLLVLLISSLGNELHIGNLELLLGSDTIDAYLCLILRYYDFEVD